MPENKCLEKVSDKLIESGSRFTVVKMRNKNILAQKWKQKEQNRTIEESLLKKSKKEMCLVLKILGRNTFSLHMTNSANSEKSRKYVKTNASSINTGNFDSETVRALKVNNLFQAYNFQPPINISKPTKPLAVVHPNVEKSPANPSETLVSNLPGEERQHLNLPKSRPIPGLSPFYNYDQLAYQASDVYFHVLHEFKSKIEGGKYVNNQ